jgi:hypothetical protein
MTPYPIILNADHAEFEREHANTLPQERPDWPLPSFDARDWAEAFLKINPTCGLDAGTMISWFANALMRGFDEQTARMAALNLDIRCEHGCTLKKVNHTIRESGSTKA